MSSFDPVLKLIALLFGGITFGTAYHLLFLSHPTWTTVPFDLFLPVFQEMILRVGTSQIIVSNIAVLACVVLFLRSKDWFWLIAIGLLLLSLPVTVFLLMPINIAFLEENDPGLAAAAPRMLREWGHYQIIRFVGDALAFVAMCKPLIWPKPGTDLSSQIGASA